MGAEEEVVPSAPALGAARRLTQDLVRENQLRVALKLVVLLLLLPLALVAYYFAVLPLLGMYLGLLVFTLLFLVGGDAERQKMAQGMVAPMLENAMDKSHAALRGELLKGLRGDVLELAPDSGMILFRHYVGPKNKIKSIEMAESSPYMGPLAAKRAKFLETKFGIATQMDDKRDAKTLLADLAKDGKKKFDVVVSYGFLSQATNLDETLGQLAKVLKPGATVVFMERTKFEDAFAHHMQKLFNWLFRACTGGTECARDTLGLLSASAGWEVAGTSLRNNETFPFSRIAVGYLQRA